MSVPHDNEPDRGFLLQEALGFRTPVYAHVSVITNPDGSKMSKRDKDKALRAAVREHAITGPPHFLRFFRRKTIGLAPPLVTIQVAVRRALPGDAQDWLHPACAAYV
jgi:glutamyl/glutaminyl-tRNA synthetase